MRLRGPLLLGLAIVAIAGAGLAAWPLIEDRAARTVETRLREETGQDWRVRGGATIDFRPSPQIVLRDLTSGADGEPLNARIRRVTVSDPFSLVFGGGGSGHLAAEGLSLRAPTTPRQGAQPSVSGAARIAKIDALVSGATVSLADAGASIAASAEKLDLDFATSEKPEKTEIKARLELPDSIASLKLDLPGGADDALAGPLRLTFEPRAADAHRLEIGGTASLKDSAFRLDAVSGTIDNEPVSGSAAMTLGAVPRVSLDLALEALTLTDEAHRPSGKAEGVVVIVPTDLIPQLAWVSGYEAKAALRVKRLTLGTVKLADADVSANVKGGRLDLALAGASAYEGTARGRYVLAPDTDKAALHQLSLSLAKIKVLPLLTDLVGRGGIEGTGQLRLDLQAKGAKVEEVRQSLSGKADLSVADGSVNGLDLAGAIGIVPGGTPRIGAFGTRLDLLAGSFSIAESQAVTNDLQLKTALVEAKGIGGIDLSARTLDIRLKPQLVASGTGREGRRRPPDVPIRVHGPWASPAFSADFSGPAKDPAGAIQGLQDLGEQFLGEDGKNLGDSLGESLGGLLDSLLPKPDEGRSGRGRPGARP